MKFRDLLHTLDPEAPPEAQPEKCIVEHINWLLNSRRERHPLCKDFGLPDFHEVLHKSDFEQYLAFELKKTLGRYEPRLAQVKVEPEFGDRGRFSGRLQANFVIEAVLVTDQTYLEFSEIAEIGYDGNVEIL